MSFTWECIYWWIDWLIDWLDYGIDLWYKMNDCCSLRFRFRTPAYGAMGWCSIAVTYMYGEWVSGVVVKARLILRTASDFRSGEVQVGCCCKKKNRGKWLFSQNLRWNLMETGKIDVKKHEESEKNSFEELPPQEMGEKWCFWAKNDVF